MREGESERRKGSAKRRKEGRNKREKPEKERMRERPFRRGPWKMELRAGDAMREGCGEREREGGREAGSNLHNDACLSHTPFLV